MVSKIKNTTKETMTVYIVTREKVDLEPNEEIEFDGDIELVNTHAPRVLPPFPISSLDTRE
jgi:hypothetical protein